MNRLSIPIGILVAIVVLLGVWYFAAHRGSTNVPVQSQTATTTAVQTSSSVAEATSTPVALDPATVATNIVGTWQSTDDPNYSVQITAAGKWTDTYSGSDSSSATETGTYELFTSADPDKDFTGVLVQGVVYAKVTEGKDVSYFSVLEADGSNLQLSYLNRGNTLSFVKVQ